MSTFSTNQARQVYVAIKENTEFVKESKLNATKGDIAIVTPTGADYFYFQYMGVDTPMRSDLINKELIMKASITHGDNLKKYLHQYDVVLDKTVSANPIAGQQYLLRIDMLGYASLGIENTNQKFGTVKATAGMTPAQFYAKMAKSLATNFSNSVWPIYQFFVSTTEPKAKDTFDGVGVTVTEVTPSTDLTKLTGGYKKLVIREVSGVWKRGTDEDMPQMAQLFTSTITNGEGLEAPWGKVEPIHNTVTSEGVYTENLTPREDTVFRQLADMEYFYLGERGDVYRNVGWPYVIGSSYLMDDLKGTAEYGIVDIHYSYVGPNEAVQKSEKDCTIIAPYAVALSLAKKMVGQGIHVLSVDKNHKASTLTA